MPWQLVLGWSAITAMVTLWVHSIRADNRKTVALGGAEGTW